MFVLIAALNLFPALPKIYVIIFTHYISQEEKHIVRNNLANMFTHLSQKHDMKSSQ
jgi:hypothetical protein